MQYCNIPLGRSLLVPSPRDNYYYSDYYHSLVLPNIKWNHIVGTLLYLVSFTQHNVHEINPVVSISTIIFYCCIVLYEYNIILSFSWAFGFFLVMTIINKAAMDILTKCLFVDAQTHFSWKYTQEWNCWDIGQICV